MINVFEVLEGCSFDAAQAEVNATFAPDATVHLAHPFETMPVADFAAADGAVGDDPSSGGPLSALYTAFPDLERRPFIKMQGVDTHGQTWIGHCGHYAGKFAAPFLDIPPTARLATMRFHEFFRVEGDQIVEMQALWDIPELMMQAGAWPMSPSLGREMTVFGPSTCDGLRIGGDGAAASAVVGDMLHHLSFNNDGEEAMRLPAFWDPRCSWYGPAGIGTARGIEGFRKHHQIPFLNAMPDRKGEVEKGHYFAQGDYVAFTAWPGMNMTLDGGGWLGIAPSGKRITMRSLDFWRVKDGLIRENWVLVDLLDAYAQLGVDVLARMRELTR